MMHLSLTALLTAALVGGSEQETDPVRQGEIATEQLVEVAPPQDAFEQLAQEYDDAVLAWRNELRGAEDSAAKREIRKRHPAREYYPRFSEMFEGGRQRAAVWMITNARFTDMSRKEANEEAKALYVRLFEGDLSDAVALEEAATRLIRDKKIVEPALATKMLASAFERTENREIKAMLGFQAGQIFGRMDGDESKQKSFEWLDRVAADFGDTPYGAQAADLVFERKHLSVGVVAPEFGGTTIDGEELKLSDYRGNIVVLDFFGFW